MPHKRRVPERFQVGTEKGPFHTTTANYYLQIYFEVLDHAVPAVKDRFDQPGYKIYQNLQELIIKACLGEDFTSELDVVTEIYGSDLPISSFTRNYCCLSHSLPHIKVLST